MSKRPALHHLPFRMAMRAMLFAALAFIGLTPTLMTTAQTRAQPSPAQSSLPSDASNAARPASKPINVLIVPLDEISGGALGTNTPLTSVTPAPAPDVLPARDQSNAEPRTGARKEGETPVTDTAASISKYPSRCASLPGVNRRMSATLNPSSWSRISVPPIATPDRRLNRA